MLVSQYFVLKLCSHKSRHIIKITCFWEVCFAWLCIAMLFACTCNRYSPRYSAFYPSPTIAVVFLHLAIFQLAITGPHNSPNFGSMFWALASSPHLSAILNVFGLIIIILKLPREVVLIMLRIIMFEI